MLVLALVAPAALASVPRSGAALGAPDLAPLSLERALATGDVVDSSSGFVLFRGDELRPQPLTVFEPSYPETRVRVFDFLGTPLVGVSSGVSHELHWGCGDFGCGFSEGVGNWLSEDPAGDIDSPNKYAYVGWRPNEATDPTGESATFVGTAVGFSWGVGYGIGSAINEGIIHPSQWQGWGHYGSQAAQFTISGAEIGASIDLAALGGGSVSATLGGAGVDSAISAFSGDWGSYGKAQLRGGAFGLGAWALFRGAAAIPGVATAGSWLAETTLARGIGQGLGAISERSGLTYLGREFSRLSAKHGFSDIAGTQAGFWDLGLGQRGLSAEHLVIRGRANSVIPGRYELPPNFKVLDEFNVESGLAHSVKSADSTMASLQTSRGFYRSFAKYLRQLDGFQTYTLSGVTVTDDLIRRRTMTMLLPPNSPMTAAQRQGLSSAETLARDLNIRLRIRFGK